MIQLGVAYAVLFILGMAAGFFLKLYLAIFLGIACVLCIYYIVYDESLGLAAIPMIFLPILFLNGLIIGIIPTLPWGSFWDIIMSTENKDFFKSYILR